MSPVFAPVALATGVADGLADAVSDAHPVWLVAAVGLHVAGQVSRGLAWGGVLRAAWGDVSPRQACAWYVCGAGLTADCLNFDDDSTLGVTFHLLQLLNNELKAHGKQSGFKDIRNAAKRYKNDLGSYRLIQLLKDRFRLNKVSASVVDIVEYPWAAIYTTNYDNGLELALQSAGRKFAPLNNLDDPKATASGTPVVHLHGFAEVWTNATLSANGGDVMY